MKKLKTFVKINFSFAALAMWLETKGGLKQISLLSLKIMWHNYVMYIFPHIKYID